MNFSINHLRIFMTSMHTTALYLLTLNMSIFTSVFSAEENIEYQIERPDSPLYTLAKSQNITVSDKEIMIRSIIETCLNTTDSIEKKIIEKKTIEEKYVCMVIDQPSDECQIRQLYDSCFVRNRNFDCNISPEEARPYIDYLCKLSRPETIYRIEDLINRFKNEEPPVDIPDVPSQRLPNDTLPSYCRFWDRQAFLLEGNNEDCIAYDTISQKCVLTLQQYNQYIRTAVEQPQSISKDSAMMFLKDNIIEKQYLSFRAKESGFYESPEIISRLAEQPSAPVSLCRIEKSQDVDYLRAIYEELYDEKYAPHENYILDIIGSTDSVYITSLYEQIITNRNIQVKQERKNEHSRKENLFPWKRIDAASLPDELMNYAKNLLPDEISPIIKTGYGYFIAKISKSVVSRAINFEDARGEIAALVIDGQLSLHKKPTLKDARNFYKTNKEKYKDQDTIYLQFSLTDDTTAHKGISLEKTCFVTIGSHLLPDSIRSPLLTWYKSSPVHNPFTHLQTIFGLITVNIIEVRQGKNYKDFSEVKEEILSELSNNILDQECVEKVDLQASIYSELVPTLFFDHLCRDIGEPAPDDLNKFIEMLHGENHPREIVPLYQNYMVRKEIDTWKSKVQWDDNMIWQAYR